MVALPDGFQQIQDPCAAQSNFIESYIVTEYYKGWRIFQDPIEGYKLHLFMWDGAPVAPMFQISATPNMLPTRLLRNVTTDAVQLSRRSISSAKDSSPRWTTAALGASGFLAPLYYPPSIMFDSLTNRTYSFGSRTSIIFNFFVLAKQLPFSLWIHHTSFYIYDQLHLPALFSFSLFPTYLPSITSTITDQFPDYLLQLMDCSAWLVRDKGCPFSFQHSHCNRTQIPRGFHLQIIISFYAYT